MADLVFAFDPAIHRPLAVPEGAPPDVADTITSAAAAAVDEAVAVAIRTDAAAVVLSGRIIDPTRASPAQAARLRTSIVALAARGCSTIVVADDPLACHDFSRMLGEPRGLLFVTPLAPLELDIRGLLVEIVSAHGPAGTSATTNATPSPLHRRIVIGWDTALWHGDRWHERPEPQSPAGLHSAASLAAAAAASPVWSQPGTFLVWASRQRQAWPGGIHHLPALQARSLHEASPGGCCTLTLLDRDSETLHGDWRGSWQEVPTHRVSWRTVAVESAAGGDEELATTIWAALEKQPAARHSALEIVRCSVACGTSVARRVRVGEIAAETLARVRDLYDAKSFRVWCSELVAEPTESLAPLGHARSGGRPGTTTSFSSALADIVADGEAATDGAGLDREAGWLALELIESI